ncbi:hypothetical protein [Altererythrobacter sp. TH136]|uniref:hypothetical protein n=1 Tax=Altererythrobacter sp. TH136 TaxID=2067415 RepID=UPI0011628E57|nr:hypothetical protein [Altererythrobacter sp. TH136]QDM40414.1 hypothetical protein C0V74_04670 [Altererythrobacter sp. TH136]
MGNDGSGKPAASAFNWATLSSEESIESYLIECRATGDDEIIRDAEYLSALAREALARQR